MHFLTSDCSLTLLLSAKDTVCSGVPWLPVLKYVVFDNRQQHQAVPWTSLTLWTDQICVFSQMFRKSALLLE